MAQKNINAAQFFTGKTPTLFKQGEAIFQQGDKLTGVYFVENGSVKIRKQDSRKNNFVLWYAEPGEIIGLTSFFSQSTYRFSAFAEHPTHVIFMSSAEFQELLNNEPELKREVISILCHRINMTETRMTDTLQRSARERLAEYLLSLISANKDVSNIPMEGEKTVYFPAKDLASIIGITNSYLQKLLAEFGRKNMIVRRRNKLVIKDVRQLLSISAGTE